MRVEYANGVFGKRMQLSILSTHLVRFLGPALGRRARGALSAAGVSVIERHPSGEWGPQLQQYLVSVEARDGADAIRRVDVALQDQGSYARFSVQHAA
jgi:hypothetical protein